MRLIIGFIVVSTTLSCAWRGSPSELNDFSAKEGEYFPKFVREFFTGANYFMNLYPTLPQARSGIRLIEVKKLNKEPQKNRNESNLSWSADGVYLSYETVSAASRRIQIKNLAGDYTSDLTVLPKGRGNFLNGLVKRSVHSYNAGLSWSRDSTRFAFMSNGGIGVYNIYVGGVGAKEKPIARSSSKDGYANWSPNSNELAFVSGRTGNGDIYVIGIKNKDLTRISDQPQVDLFPEWFPSGNRIAFCGGTSANHDIYVAERKPGGKEWGKPRRVTSWTQDDLRPTISPDGKMIAFYATDFNTSKKNTGRPTWNIHVIPYIPGKIYHWRELQGTTVAENVVVDLNTGPAWTPDSRKIFYVKHEPKVFNPIYGFDLYTGQTYRLDTQTRMNRDILMSRLGILSFRAQDGVWDRVYVALTNQGSQLQTATAGAVKIKYLTKG